MMPPMVRRFLVWLALSLALVAIAVPGHAQWDPAKQFNEGLALFDKGEFDAAMPFFKNAFERTKSPNARLYVALCLTKLGRDLEAYREMKATLDLASTKAEIDPKYNQTRDTAAAELSQLEEKVGKVVVTFSDEYPGAEALINGELVDPSDYDVPIAVNPGEVEVSASATGMDDFATAIQVEGGQTQTVAISLEAVVMIDGEDDAGGWSPSTLQIVGLAVTGLGVAGLVVFAVTGSQAASNFAQVEDECVSRCTGDKFIDVIDDGKSLQTIANVMLGVGIALTAGGAAMIIFGGDGDEEGENSDDLEARARLLPMPGGAALTISGTF
jgi:hypothetical protein